MLNTQHSLAPHFGSARKSEIKAGHAYRSVELADHVIFVPSVDAVDLHGTPEPVGAEEVVSIPGKVFILNGSTLEVLLEQFNLLAMFNKAGIDPDITAAKDIAIP